MKAIVITLCTMVIIFAVGVASFVYLSVQAIEGTTLNNDTEIIVEVSKGSSLYSVKNQLSQYAELESIDFKIWAKLNPEFNKIQAGYYEFPTNIKLVDALATMRSGKVKQFGITLIEGQTWLQWYTTIRNNPILKQDLGEADSVYHKLVQSNDEFCANAFENIEGCLLPDTYYFVYNASALSIVKRAYIAMDEVLNNAWQNRFADIPIQSPFEIIILASIIEKETAIENERDEIAGVFVNRLNKGMRLQTDPTVIYGIGTNFDGNITRKHLRTPTPYNTYVIKGLPITPIAMPSKASLLAATRPATTDALYFVATGTGGHYFSSSLAEHNAALKRYLDLLKKNKTN